MDIKKSVYLILLTMCIITLFILGGCVKTEEGAPENVSNMFDKIKSGLNSTVKNTSPDNRTWYEIFVYSFCDSNGDGIGDLNGVTQMLDYIEYMGFSGIWLTPIHPSGTYHKYDVTDYYAIDPQFGTLDDFDKLIAECEKRGIAVIIDMVINHTSSAHEWFKAAKTAAVNGTDSEYLDYYNFAESAGNGQWKQLGGLHYECQFWSEMPDLDLENKQVREELEQIFKFWLDRGVSGFRLDAAKEYVSGNTEKNIEILSWVNRAVKAVKPNAYLVAEVWEANTGLYDYYRSGIDSFFNFNFSGADGRLAKAILLDSAEVKKYIDALTLAENRINVNNPAASDAQFFTNHDTARACGFLRRDANLIKMAWGMSLMQSGDSFIYYGEEIGMLGTGEDPNKRLPMLWTNNTEDDTITNAPPGSKAAAYEFPSVEEQLGNSGSILEYVREAVILRNKYPEIAGGKIIEATVSPDKVITMRKSYNDSEITLYCNLSQDTAEVSSENAPTAWLSATGTEPEFSNGALTLPPYTIVIIVK